LTSVNLKFVLIHPSISWVTAALNWNWLLIHWNRDSQCERNWKWN